MEMNPILARAERLTRDPEARRRIELPAMRELLEQVGEANATGFAYKKHADHTKSSQKGCVMGCIAG